MSLVSVVTAQPEANSKLRLPVTPRLRTPEKALEWVQDKMIPYYPLGVYKDRSAKEEAK